ncbi:hypothetical protein V6N12_058792 [Hibiscus sabdariffa]|uniref:RNase H type-1 domain-containing protein n=1 Tax=Hibiscus sabdariffa TaxID=183260 RepID=A0ABR2ET66_9ROSI
MHFRKVVVEVDSLEALRFISKGSKDHDSLGLVLHIRELCERQWSVSFQHIHREGNRAADRLAKLTNCEMLDTRVYYAPPPRLFLFYRPI